MCGIIALLGVEDAEPARPKVLKAAKLARHRGPDWSGLHVVDGVILAHERLAIVDPDSGDQPLFSRDGSVALAVNGEIYNYKELQQQVLERDPDAKFYGSDCEVLLHLYDLFGADLLKQWSVRGMFAFVLYDAKTKRAIVGRDHIGIIPLYYGLAKDGAVWVASELKCFGDECVNYREFPPGHLIDFAVGEVSEPQLWYDDTQQSWWAAGETNEQAPGSTAPRSDLATYQRVGMDRFLQSTKDVELRQIRDSLVDAVRSHLMADVPFGVLLSGGLDSSLVALVTARLLPTVAAAWPTLHTFSVGLAESPDLAAAKKVANNIGSHHHSIVFTPQQGIDALQDVIYHIETFDVTTVRSSTPMYLMARKIRASGVKMVLSGEGADELFGGYLYFHKAPGEREFAQETARKVRQLHKYDCLRANKAMMAWSVEVRVPFLDRHFMETAMSVSPGQKMCYNPDSGAKRIEKHILRAAFDDHQGDYQDAKSLPFIPREVLWRQKEQFSDGVGYSWIDAIQEYAEKQVSDAQMKAAHARFPNKTPRTKEAYLYRQLFVNSFGENNASAEGCVQWQDSIACSSAAALAWDPLFRQRADASGRAVEGVHDAAKEEIDSSVV